jgi:acetyl-CoA carboxylase biotin carboxylase subunit
VFKKILIANRGEIALRVIRACKDMGIQTVAVYSTVDRSALHVRFADESICIGPASATRSYLNQPAVLTAMEITGCDAVHPGYGFMAENPQFAEAVEKMGATFIGPAVEHLNMFGDKLSAKAAARNANLPLLAGSEGAVATIEDAVAAAEVAGYPVMLKAAAGGGGKGMRVVHTNAELGDIFELTQAESLAAFGSAEVFVERYLGAPRHIEVQVAGDGKGNGRHYGTRDCSLQRRHQKIVEEAPAPYLSDKLRRDICVAAVELIKSVNYKTVGTVEFLVQGEGFFFLEVNPRIQVEHPVTEAVTGVDLVQEQIRLAAGQGFSLSQKDIKVTGHALEVRVNAEDPYTFIPSPGIITGYHEPGGPGIRVDSTMHEHAIVHPYYDSLIGKVIVHAADRNQAIRRMTWAIDEMIVEGIKVTLPIQRELIGTDAFRDGEFSTHFVDDWISARK